MWKIPRTFVAMTIVMQNYDERGSMKGVVIKKSQGICEGSDKKLFYLKLSESVTFQKLWERNCDKSLIDQ